jgi:ABC-2 type transport system ATP-binding protein
MHVFGLDCHHQSVQVRREVAYLPAEAKMFRSFRGDQVIRFFAAMHPRGDLARALEIADRLQLATRRRVAFMSTGMRQKLAIACTLSCQAPLVILDEPTANLDPTVRREVIGLVQQAKQEGRTIIFSSHVLSEIEEACQLAAIMREGRVVHEVDLEHLKARHRIVGRWRGSFPFEKVSLPEQVAAIESSPDRITMEVAGPLEGHLAWLSQLPIDQMKMESASLRSLYESHQDSAGS